MTLKDKTALITGSTDGVGALVAKKLAALGILVLVHGRNQARGARLVGDISKGGGRAQFYPADFASLSGVRRLAENIQRDHQRLDILVNNAGIGTGGRNSTREISEDGFELRFAVNYLSGFLLTRLLIPLLRTSAPARIVNVASVGQEPIAFDNVMLERGYSGQRAYCQSKLAQVMFTFDLAQELTGTGITVNCLHPATYMDTAMVRRDGISPMSSVEDGAKAVLHIAISSETKNRTGLYFDQMRQSRANAQAYDSAARQQLRTLSYELSGLAILQ
jgi:NAD(P)-dependent dehydrogenase (short-subunit alcohol dehydrogenase family)